MHKDYDQHLKLIAETLSYLQKKIGPNADNVIYRKLSIQLSTTCWRSLKQNVKIRLPDEGNLDEFVRALSPLYLTKVVFPSLRNRIIVCTISLLCSLWRLFGNNVLCHFYIEDGSFEGMVYRNSEGDFIQIDAIDIGTIVCAISIIRNLIRTADMQTI